MSHTDDSGFVLGDLLDGEELGLRLVAGGTNARRRRLLGALCVDLPHPGTSLDQDWLLLSPGSHLGESAQSDAEFIAEIIEAGAAGMGLALDIVHPAVPETILAPASEHDFPIFTVPRRTSLRGLASQVFQAISSPDVRASRRLVAIQRTLVDALKDETPRDRLLRTLASLTGAGVAVTDMCGRLEFHASPPPTAAVRQCLESRPVAILHLTLQDRHGFALPVTDDTPHARGWLILTWPLQRAIPALAEATAHLVVPLLSAVSRLSRIQITAAREMRRAALNSLLDRDGGDDPRTLNARCRGNGINLSDGVRAVAVASGALAPRAPLLEACEATLEQAHSPFLAADQGEHVAIVLPASVTDGFIAQHLLSHGSTLRAGVGRAVVDGPGVVDSWADAELALSARTRRAATRIIRYDDLDLGTVLLNEVRVARLGPKINQIIEPLADNPLLRQTLVVYLHHDQDVGRTARALGLHPNSVRYRLARAEDALGVSIRTSSTIVALHLALLVHDDLTAANLGDGGVVGPANLARIPTQGEAPAARPA